jgi:hypothetical protein
VTRTSLKTWPATTRLLSFLGRLIVSLKPLSLPLRKQPGLMSHSPEVVRDQKSVVEHRRVLTSDI